MERQQLPLGSRLALHSTEAQSIHVLKAHVELLEAYRWHQISARRQDNMHAALRNGTLEHNALLVQMDFKENVRYPMRTMACIKNKEVDNNMNG